MHSLDFENIEASNYRTLPSYQEAVELQARGKCIECQHDNHPQKVQCALKGCRCFAEWSSHTDIYDLKGSPDFLVNQARYKRRPKK